MIVVAIVSGLALFALPRFRGLHAASQLAAARQEVEAGIATARAAAIQKGRRSYFSITGNAMLVSVDTSDSGQRDTILSLRPLDSLYRVRVTPGAQGSQVMFGPRGWVTPLANGNLEYVLQRGTRIDTLCFRPTGQLMGRGCTL
jgi:Tfp pilus assembly protein FimT